VAATSGDSVTSPGSGAASVAKDQGRVPDEDRVAVFELPELDPLAADARPVLRVEVTDRPPAAESGKQRVAPGHPLVVEPQRELERAIDALANQAAGATPERDLVDVAQGDPRRWRLRRLPRQPDVQGRMGAPVAL